MITTYPLGDLKVPKGRMYFDPLIAGSLEGARYLGNTPEFLLNVTTERNEEFHAECGFDQLVADTIASITRTGSVTTKNLSDDAYSYFMIGDKVTIAQASAAGVTETFDVKQGLYYQLGKDSSFPTGARAGTLNSIGAFVEGTDFEFDGDLMRLYITPGGGIADDTSISPDYDLTDVSWVQVRGSRSEVYEGEVWIIECLQSGEEKVWYFPKSRLTPNGDLAVKRLGAEAASMPLAISVLEPGDGRLPFYIDGEAA